MGVDILAQQTKMGVDILGVDITGVDVLGVEVMALSSWLYFRSKVTKTSTANLP